MSLGSRGLLPALVLFFALPGATGAQSVSEIVEGMYGAAERQAAGVEDYTVIQRVMGIETLSYFERATLDGPPIFRLKSSDGGGFSLSLAGEDVGLGDVFLYGPKLVELGRYAGSEQIGAFTVHVIAVDDAAALDIAPPQADGARFTTKSVRLYVDADLMVPRRIVLVGDASTDSGPQELTIQVDMESILPIETLLVPFRTKLEVGGATMEVTVGEVLINAGPPPEPM